MKTRSLLCLIGALTWCSLGEGFAVPPHPLTVSPQIPQRPHVYVRKMDFGNGAHAEQIGNTFTITTRNGNQMTFNHPVPTPAALNRSVSCENLKFWLDRHGAHEPKWRERCLTYFDYCLSTI